MFSSLPFENQARAAARRSGPACATSRHVTAHRRQASAQLRMVSPLCFPHSAAQASHRSEFADRVCDACADLCEACAGVALAEPMGLIGSWNVGPEAAVLQAVASKVMFRFHARDLNLILAPAKDGKPVRFKVTLDGTAPGDNNGADTGADGNSEIREPRMYQLIRQKDFPIIDHTFEIEFLDPGARVLDFTFG
jgi:thioredoxin family protein